MIINRAPAHGTLGGAGRGQARSERGGLAGPGAAPSPAGFAAAAARRYLAAGWKPPSLPARVPHPSPLPVIRLAVQPRRLALAPAPPSVRLCAEETSVSAAPEPRGAVVSQEANASSSQLPQVLRSAPEHHPPGCD